MEKEHRYYTLYEKYKKEILNDIIKAGELLDSERTLSLKHNVSRNTIRKMIDLLLAEDLVYKIQGKGTVVSKRKIKQNLNAFYSFHEQMQSLGKKPSSKLVGFSTIKSNEFLSQIFNIPLNSNILHIKRLRLVNNKPLMLENTYLPEYRFKNFNFKKLNTESMYKIFEENYEVKFEKAVESLKPIVANKKDDIAYLLVPKNMALMEIVRTTYEKSKVIEYTISHVNGDEFEYVVQLNKF